MSCITESLEWESTRLSQHYFLFGRRQKNQLLLWRTSAAAASASATRRVCVNTRMIDVQCVWPQATQRSRIVITACNYCVPPKALTTGVQRSINSTSRCADSRCTSLQNFVTDHRPSAVEYRSCLSVRLSDDNFRKPWRRKFIFAHRLCRHGQVRIWMLSGQGHRCKKVENFCSRNVKLAMVITPVL